MMIEVPCAETFARELRQEEILFVRRVIRSDDAELAAVCTDSNEFFGNGRDCFRP